MGIIGARREDKVYDGSRCKKSVIPLLHTCGAKGKSFLLGKQLRAHRDKGCPLQSGASSLWWGSLG